MKIPGCAESVMARCAKPTIAAMLGCTKPAIVAMPGCAEPAIADMSGYAGPAICQQLIKKLEPKFELLHFRFVPRPRMGALMMRVQLANRYA